MTDRVRQFEKEVLPAAQRRVSGCKIYVSPGLSTPIHIEYSVRISSFIPADERCAHECHGSYRNELDHPDVEV